jgi:hypothetical protein
LPHKGGKGADRVSLIIERRNITIIIHNTFSVSKFKLFINVGSSHGEPFIHRDVIHLRTEKLNLEMVILKEKHSVTAGITTVRTTSTKRVVFLFRQVNQATEPI